MQKEQKEKTILEKDPAYSWGMIFYLSGLMQLTLMPYLSYLNHFFPHEYFYIIPGCILLFLSIVLWFFAKEEYPQKALITGGGLVYFGAFELIVYPERNNNYYYLVYSIVILTGILYILATYDLLKKTFRKNLIVWLIETASLISIGLLLNALLYFFIH